MTMHNSKVRDTAFILFSEYHHLSNLQVDLLGELDEEHSYFVTNLLRSKCDEITRKKDAKYREIDTFLNNIMESNQTNG